MMGCNSNLSKMESVVNSSTFLKVIWKIESNESYLMVQAVRIIFTRKSKQIDHPKIYCNDIEVHKHLGLILD